MYNTEYNTLITNLSIIRDNPACNLQDIIYLKFY